MKYLQLSSDKSSLFYIILKQYFMVWMYTLTCKMQKNYLRQRNYLLNMNIFLMLMNFELVMCLVKHIDALIVWQNRCEKTLSTVFCIQRKCEYLKMHWRETRHESANNTLTTKWETDLSMSLLLGGRCKFRKQGFIFLFQYQYER